MNLIQCPNCGCQTNNSHCPNCGMQLIVPTAQPVYYPQQRNVNTAYRQNTSQLVRCSACGNPMYQYADKCPYCGKPRDRKVISLWFLDIICILSMVFSVMLFSEPNAFRYLGYLIMLFWLIVYSVILWIYKNEPNYDISKVKQSRNAVFIMFLLTYGIGFVVIF